jgi:hypothetical protein
MAQTLRVRIVTAIFLALLLVAAAASPIVTDVAGLGGTAYADECGGSSC